MTYSASVLLKEVRKKVRRLGRHGQVFKQQDGMQSLFKSGTPGFTGSRSGAARGANTTTCCLKTCSSGRFMDGGG